MSYIKKITDQLKNLILMAHNRFPENKDISLALTGVETLCKHNRQKLFKIFVAHVYLKKTASGIPFRKLIKDRNEIFFMNEDTEHIVNIKGDNETISKVINGIKNNWKELDEEERKAIWIYFDVFFKLTDKYYIEQSKNKIDK